MECGACRKDLFAGPSKTWPTKTPWSSTEGEWEVRGLRGARVVGLSGRSAASFLCGGVGMGHEGEFVGVGPRLVALDQG